MRTSIGRTSAVTVDMYSLLFGCCERYYNNIAWKFPEQCSEGQACCGLDLRQFSIHMKFEIPALHRNSQGLISKPNCDSEKYDQFGLLDLIEFIGHNCKDIIVDRFHSYLEHNHIRFLESNAVVDRFRSEINGIFQKTGLLFILTDKMTVERVIEYDVLSPQVEKIMPIVKEQGIHDLLNEAVEFFKQPKTSARNNAVEKLWDVFERLKTYYAMLDKKSSAAKIVTDMSNGQAEFNDLFENEFKVLTAIGNNFRIRHHETNKVNINDNKHFDYLFDRCLSLIIAAIPYLQ